MNISRMLRTVPVMQPGNTEVFRSMQVNTSSSTPYSDATQVRRTVSIPFCYFFSIQFHWKRKTQKEREKKKDPKLKNSCNSELWIYSDIYYYYILYPLTHRNINKMEKSCKKTSLSFYFLYCFISHPPLFLWALRSNVAGETWDI